MKKYLPLLFVLITASAVYGQTNKKYLKYQKKYDYYEGYIVLANGSQQSGLVKHNGYSKVTFVSKNGMKRVYRPVQLTEYGTVLEKFVADKRVFYKVIINGKKASLYRLSYKSSWFILNVSNNGAPTTYVKQVVREYVKKSEETVFTEVKKKNFQVVFSDYFGECANLKDNISKQKLTTRDIKEIVYQYNYQCGGAYPSIAADKEDRF